MRGEAHPTLHPPLSSPASDTEFEVPVLQLGGQVGALGPMLFNCIWPLLYSPLPTAETGPSLLPKAVALSQVFQSHLPPRHGAFPSSLLLPRPLSVCPAREVPSPLQALAPSKQRPKRTEAGPGSSSHWPVLQMTLPKVTMETWAGASLPVSGRPLRVWTVPNIWGSRAIMRVK